MIITLTILNLLDYILTLLNRGNFEEANPIANLIIGNVWLLSILKLIIVPLCIYILYKYRYTLISKIGTIALSGVYLYAVVLGVLYLIVNVKMGCYSAYLSTPYHLFVVNLLLYVLYKYRHYPISKLGSWIVFASYSLLTIYHISGLIFLMIY